MCLQTEAEKAKSGLEQRVQQLESELQAASRSDLPNRDTSALNRSSSTAGGWDSSSANKDMQAKLDTAELQTAQLQQQNAQLAADKYVLELFALLYVI